MAKSVLVTGVSSGIGVPASGPNALSAMSQPSSLIYGGERRADHDPTQQQWTMVALWERHMAAECETKNIDATMATMTSNPFVNHVPVMTGGVGSREVHEFYSAHFIPGHPPGTEVEPVESTVGTDRIVVVQFQDGKIAGERIYWDQASVLAQVGLVDAEKLPVTGLEASRKIVDPTQEPSNGLIKRVR